MLLRYLGAGALALALLTASITPSNAAPPGPCKLNQVIVWAWSIRIIKCLDEPDPPKRETKRRHSGELTDVSAARRMSRGNHIRTASLPPARYRGGSASRIRRGISPPPRMDLARASQTDRDGRGYASQEAGVSAPIRTASHRRAWGVARAAIGGARASAQVAVEYSRPANCRGIPWCGCWLRTALGIADSSLNLAANWARVGQPATIETANIVVWPHHVGKLLGHRPGQLLIQSGNDGGAVRTRWVSPNIRGHVLAYRRV